MSHYSNTYFHVIKCLGPKVILVVRDLVNLGINYFTLKNTIDMEAHASNK